QQIGRAHDLRFIILHGSYATGKEYAGSDVDIAILGKTLLAFDEVLHIHGELADIFGDSKERELDLKTLHRVDSLFRYQVVCDGVLLYGNKRAYEEFKGYAFRDYVDSSDLRELQDLLLKKSIIALS
ncbi:MAG: nucleotidyltransferase domain-containing protein, partial [Candidatus Colwellbacteria bacterium]|nr:nucleotidyltransferase domain-containing protein [Candidatus Colwellbacteria bacterium]